MYTIHMTSRSPNISRHRFISTPSIDVLEKLGVFFACHLTPHNHHPTRAVESAAQGGEKYMTSEEMYRHLNHIQGLVPPESRTHFQIETIVSRASAMLQGDRRITLKLEDGARPLEVPLLERSGIRKLSSPTGYSVGVVSNAEKGNLFQIPSGLPNSGLCSPQHAPIPVNTTMGGASGIFYRQVKISGDSSSLAVCSCQGVCPGYTT